MEERIRLVVEAQNRANPVLQAVGRGFSSMATNAKSAGASASQAATTVRTAMSHVASAVGRTGAAFVALSRTAHSSISSILTPLGALSRGLSAVGGVLGGLSIAAFTKAGIDMNLTVDRAAAALTKMTGSAQVASTFVEALRKEAETSAPTLAELLPIAQQLAAAYGPQGLGKVIPTLRAFGDTAVSLGAGTEGMSLALLGFRQLLGRDFPQQEELNQVRENLPGLDVNGILKRSFGTADTDMLKDAGVTGQMVGDALVRGMQQAFGGAQAQGAMKLPTLLSNFQDTFSRAAGNITLGLLRSLEGANGAVTRLLGSFQKLAEGEGFMGGLTVAFNGLGHALEIVSGAGDQVVAWLDQVISREGVAMFLTNTLALLKTIGESVLKTFGVDLKAAMDPKNVMGFFDALGQAADAGISTFFGVGRVAAEVVRIIQSSFEDLGDRVSDIIEDVTRGMKTMFLSMQISMGEATASMMDNLGKVLSAIAQIEIGFGNAVLKPFANLGTTGADMQDRARTMRDQDILLLKQDREDLIDGEHEVAGRRNARAQQRLAADPYRNDPFFKRIGDAFTGRPGQSGAEDAFRALLESNRLGIARSLFAGATATSPAVPFPAAPTLYGGGGGGGSVTYARPNVPMIPSLPDSMRPVMGSASRFPGGVMGGPGGDTYGAAYGRMEAELNRLDLLPSRLPNYQQSDAYASEFTRQRDGGFQYGSMYEGNRAMTDSYPASNAYTSDFIRQRDGGFQYGSMYGGGTVNVNVHATITREGMIAAAEEAYEELVRRGIAGPSGF